MMDKRLEVSRASYTSPGSRFPHQPWTTPLPEAESPERYETLSDLLAVVRERWKTVLGCVLACFVLGALACLILKPKYTASASLEVNSETPAMAGGSLPGAAGLPDEVKTEVETDTNVLQSSDLALAVIQKLKLENDAPFRAVHVRKEADLSLDRAPKTRDTYLKLFAKNLKVSSVPDSRLITVAFRNPDPAVAAEVANTLAETFIAQTLERRLHANSTVSFWISKEIGGLRERVRLSEQALADFEHKTGLAGIDVQSATQTGGQSGLAMQAHNGVLDRLNTLNAELTTAEANRISSEAIYKLTQSQDPETVLGLGSMNLVGGGSVLAQGGGLDLLRTLRSQQAALKVQLADLQTRYGPQNPRLVELTSQLQAMDSEIAAEMARIRERAENDYKYAQANQDALRAQLARQQQLADKFTDQTVQLQLLSQEAFSNRTLYQNLYSELNQANVAAGIHATRLDIVDRALIPGTPSSPSPFLLLAASLGAGLVLGILCAFLRQSIDVSVRVARDVESTVHIPVIAQLPMLGEGAARASMLHAPRSAFAESCRSLCTAVLGLLESGSQPRVLLVSSPFGGDGKTTVSYNIAVALAQRGERVLLLDANLRDPGLQHFFPNSGASGLADVLEHRAPRLADSITEHPQLPNLALLPAGRTPELPAELFSSEAFERLLDEARAHYRWTVIDSPSLLPFTDATVIADKVDGVVAVARAGSTSREGLRAYTQLLLRMRAPLLGFALNCAADRLALPPHASPERSLQKVSQHV